MRKLLLIPLIAAITLGISATDLQAELSPKAESAFQKGIAKVQTGSWSLGIRYFEQVLRENPFHAPALFNMGLANARAGEELQAIAWFNAYLPYADDEQRTQILSEIRRLTEQADKDVAILTKTLTDSIAASPDPKYALKSIAEYYMEIGQAEKAAKLSEQYDLGFDTEKYTNLVGVRAYKLGDFRTAADLLGKVSDPDYKNFKKINAEALMKSGQENLAWAAAMRLQNDEHRFMILSDYALREIAAGDPLPAEELLESSGGWLTTDEMRDVLKAYFDYKLKSGEPLGVDKLIGMQQREDAKALVYRMAAEAAFDADEKSAAKKYADQCLALKLEEYYVDEQAPAYIYRDDLPGALKTIKTMELNGLQPENHVRMASDIIQRLVNKGRLREAERFAADVSRIRRGQGEATFPKRGLADGYADRGDFDKALQILESIPPYREGQRHTMSGEYLKASGTLYVIEKMIDAGETERATALFNDNLNFLKEFQENYTDKVRIRLAEINSDAAANAEAQWVRYRSFQKENPRHVNDFYLKAETALNKYLLHKADALHVELTDEKLFRIRQAIFISDYYDLETEMQRAQEYSNDYPPLLAGYTTDVLRNLYLSVQYLAGISAGTSQARPIAEVLFDIKDYV